MKQIDKIIKIAAEYNKETLSFTSLSSKIPKGTEVANWIDHTLLKTEATFSQIKQLCSEAQQFSFASICINPVYVPFAANLLKETSVLVGAVIGFPLGASLNGYKAVESMGLIAAGAQEIDMVLHVGALKEGAFDLVYKEVLSVVQIAHSQNVKVKVIIETGLLTQSEKIIASLLVKEAGADFVKTSTGMMAGGATVEDIRLIRHVVGEKIGVKASGGIRTYADFNAMVLAGATRIGSSAGVKIMEDALKG